MPKGIKIEELKSGNGQTALRNTIVRVRYTGSLSHGEVFQKDLECTIDLARRNVIAGLRYGIEGMLEGGHRKLRISPHLGYGEEGVSGIIPSNAVLIFEVELLEVIPAPL
jgi:FKBP-type peptidyl-prolyl cis-trans isomerase